MLAGCDSNASGRDLAKCVGDMELGYGSVNEIVGDKYTGTWKLAFAHPRALERPQNGAQFSNWAYRTHNMRK